MGSFVVHASTDFHENQAGSFSVILLTSGQTEKQMTQKTTSWVVVMKAQSDLECNKCLSVIKMYNK